jgi:hypothetical protein
MTAWALFAALVVVPPSQAWIVLSRAELQAGYDRLWAVSDVHGHREELERLLGAAGLASADGAGEVHWNPRSRRQLLIVAGDLVGGGPDGRGVLELVARLAAEAPATASRVLVLLGNEEARRLAGTPSRHVERLLDDAVAAAFVGPWLFAHSGFIDARPDEASLQEWLDGTARAWAGGGRHRYAHFLTGRSILDCHEWWKSRRNRKAMRAILALLGLEAVVFGHDPAALGAPKTIAIDGEGFLVKLDTGLKRNLSSGMLLRCEVAEALRDRLSACRAQLPDGTVAPLAIGPAVP